MLGLRFTTLNRSLRNMLADPVRGLELSLLLLLALLLVGTLGYILIEGMDLVEALYMTVITITTVGFGEVRPLSSGGRVFTSLLIFLGVAVVTTAITNIASIVLGPRLWHMIREQRMNDSIATLEHHYIVCGYGRMGQQIVRDLQNRKQPFLVIENDEERRDELLEDGMYFIIGDATLDETLERAGIDGAQGLVAALNSDADNVMTVLSAREINPRLYIVARAADPQSESKLRRAGADRVVSPYIIGGHRMAVALLRPAVHDFMNQIFHVGDEANMDIGQVRVAPTSPLVGKSIAQTNLRQTRNVNILAVQLADGKLIVNPNSQHQIQPGEVLIVIGPADAIFQTEAELDAQDDVSAES
jgi:voltage-gated potassium channel